MLTDKRSRRATLAALCATFIIAASTTQAEDLWPDLSKPAKAIGGGEHDAAVVIGVENYFAVPGVPGAKSNAGEWYDYLTETRGVPPQNVKLLTNADATREEILGSASKAAGQAGSKGTLWFVFVGHGAPSADGKDGLLVGVDAQQKSESLQTRSVRRGELLKTLAASPAGSIRVVLDACFSGRGQDGSTIAPGLQPLVTVAAIGSLDPRIAVLTAAKGDQFAGSLPGANRPAFSYLVLGGLRGWASGADGKITAGSLWNYTKNALAATLRGRDQTPDLLGAASSVMAASAGEKGPNLAGLAKATAGGGFVEITRPAQATEGMAGIQWVAIPGGKFTMGYGNEMHGPEHGVTIKSFQLAKTLVTNKQYKACVAASICSTATSYGSAFEGGDQPVVGVDWNQAKAFSEWVGGRLPSEAEWEYAARSAGKNQAFPWSDGNATCDRAVIAGCNHTATSPVCSKPQGNTAQGLCDMVGNVWEWTQDWSHASYIGAPSDGSAWVNPAGEYRVARGGCYVSYAWNGRRITGQGYLPEARNNGVGFRPVR